MNWRDVFGQKEIISTARSISTYRRLLFPECRSDEELLRRLDGKTVLDLGCGMTPWNPNSLYARARSGSYKIRVVGVDRKMDHGDFTFRDRVVSWIAGLSRWPVSGANGSCASSRAYLVKARLEALPFKTHTADVALSCFGILPYLRSAPDDLWSTLSQVGKILSHNGVILLHPVSRNSRRVLFDIRSPVGQLVQEQFQAKRTGWRTIALTLRHETDGWAEDEPPPSP